MTNNKKINKKEKTNELPPFQLILQTLKFFYKDIYHYQPIYFILVIINILVNALSPFINIIFPKLIIDEMMGSKNIKRLILLIVITILGNMIANIIKNSMTENMGKYEDLFDRYYKIKISDKTMTMDFENTEDPEVLEQASRAEDGMDNYSGGIAGITGNFMTIISNAITLFGVTLVLAGNFPILLAVIVIGIIFRTFINARSNALSVTHFKAQVSLNRAFGYIFYSLSRLHFGKDIRLYGATDMMYEKGTFFNQAMSNKWKCQAMEQLPLGEADVFIGALTDGFTYLYLGYQAIKRYITIGEFSMFVVVGSNFSNSLKGIIWNLQEIYKKATFMYEYIKFMNYKTSINIETRTVPEAEAYVFEFINVSFKYPRADEYVLKNINLTISSKEHLSVVGLNGAGKTTFIKLLCRLYDVSEGEIQLNGVNIKEFEYNEYSKLFAVVFQDFQLFAFSMKENILLRDDIPEDITIIKKRNHRARKENKTDKNTNGKNFSDDDLLGLCEVCGLGDKIASLEKGLDTVLYKQFDEDGIEPSGGEAQKLAITRALYKDAPVVILDEPTAALDPIAEYEIYNQFDRLVGGKTAVYISHRLSSCRFCDRIAVFSKATVAEYGSHEELLKIPNGIYAEMFTAQAQYYVE